MLLKKLVLSFSIFQLFLSSFIAPASFAASVETVGDLKVSGVIESTSGGFKFPDGSSWTTSGLSGLLFNVGFVVDDSASNTGNLNSGAIKFGSGASGEGIASQRTSGVGQNGLDFYTNNTSRIFIRDNGNVGIGTRTPAEQLQITGNLRLPPTTASAGIIKSGANNLLHTFGGDENFFAGVNAGNTTMTSGGGNTGVGQSVLGANVSGIADTGLGTRALWNNTTGSSNTAVGYATLYFNTSGVSNTAVGFGALYSNLTGYYNTAVGFRALYASTGQGNTAVGQDSLFYNTGNSNVAFGSSALLGNTTGIGNTALGYYAGYTFTTTNANTTGTYNTFIGFNSGPGTATQLTNATAIGSQAKVNTSNSLVLGGTGVSAVNVGIGTAAPTEALDVVGNVKISGTLTPGSLSSASIGSAALVDAAVTSAKLAGGAVTSVKLADGAVTATKIANSAVTAAKLNIDGDFRINDSTLYLRGNNGDNAHGLGWFNSSTKPFMGTAFDDGPVLFGAGGGALGTWSGSSHVALTWNSSGDVTVTGRLSAGTKAFKIDHPLDPRNKYLYHTAIESSDMMNIYNGNVTTDEQGYAKVALPEWFEALNRDFRYQLTVIDETDGADFVQVKVVRKVSANSFTIRTSDPHVEVSWQVTGIRKDAYAEKHRIQVEEEKPAAERGRCIHPEACGED